jgi:hypothetical protein
LLTSVVAPTSLPPVFSFASSTSILWSLSEFSFPNYSERRHSPALALSSSLAVEAFPSLQLQLGIRTSPEHPADSSEPPSSLPPPSEKTPTRATVLLPIEFQGAFSDMAFWFVDPEPFIPQGFN